MVEEKANYYDCLIHGTNVHWCTETASNHDHGEMSLDFQERKVYLAAYYGGRLERANFDGSEREVLLEKRHYPFGIATDGINR